MKKIFITVQILVSFISTGVNAEWNHETIHTLNNVSASYALSLAANIDQQDQLNSVVSDQRNNSFSKMINQDTEQWEIEEFPALLPEQYKIVAHNIDNNGKLHVIYMDYKED